MKTKFLIPDEFYYPQWHGTSGSLKDNLTYLSKRYKQEVIVAGYTEHKREVNDIVFNLPGNKGKGTCIGEPLNTREYFIDMEGKTNDLINIYQKVAK